MALTGTSKQFQVVYDKTLGGVSITTESSYTPPVGGELAAPAGSTANMKGHSHFWLWLFHAIATVYQYKPFAFRQ